MEPLSHSAWVALACERSGLAHLPDGIVKADALDHLRRYGWRL